jgi:hypothetical protein
MADLFQTKMFCYFDEEELRIMHGLGRLKKIMWKGCDTIAVNHVLQRTKKCILD